jgi:hypothetical protein
VHRWRAGAYTQRTAVHFLVRRSLLRFRLLSLPDLLSPRYRFFPSLPSIRSHEVTQEALVTRLALRPCVLSDEERGKTTREGRWLTKELQQG